MIPMPRGPMMPMPPMMGPPRGHVPFMAVLPDYLPGTASLFEQLDKQILVSQKLHVTISSR
jgi:hypothetical protein